MTPFVEYDAANDRTVSMWEEGGIQFRSNILHSLKSRVELHSHSFDHQTFSFGWFLCHQKFEDGTERKFQVASKGYKPKRTDIEFKPECYRFNNPAGVVHGFELLEIPDGYPAEILCVIAMEQMK